MGKKRVSAEDFLSLLLKMYPHKEISLMFTKDELDDVSSEYNVCIPVVVHQTKVSPRLYNLSGFKKDTNENKMTMYLKASPEKHTEEEEIISEPQNESISEIRKEIEMISDFTQYIPKEDRNFVAFGANYKLINKVVSSLEFFPLYIWGISGVGKTLQIEQSCAINNRPLFRVQVTRDITNEDLIGSYSLKDGNTVWEDGPVLRAYRTGGVLLLDEVDMNPHLMALQVVLENKPIYVNQTGELVAPREGFTVFATGNTKGDGGDAKYVGASILNDAFLERFVAILEQKIPTEAVEKKIINKYIENNNIDVDNRTLNNFFEWIKLTRKCFIEGDIDFYITSRRSQYILKTFKVTNDFNASMKLVLGRYPDGVGDQLYKTWKAIHGGD